MTERGGEGALRFPSPPPHPTPRNLKLCFNHYNRIQHNNKVRHNYRRNVLQLNLAFLVLKHVQNFYKTLVSVLTCACADCMHVPIACMCPLHACTHCMSDVHVCHQRHSSALDLLLTFLCSLIQTLTLTPPPNNALLANMD